MSQIQIKNKESIVQSCGFLFLNIKNKESTICSSGLLYFFKYQQKSVKNLNLSILNNYLKGVFEIAKHNEQIKQLFNDIITDRY